jgi:polysaccharide deacetylase family protein (PEP-CTERM system associated)
MLNDFGCGGTEPCKKSRLRGAEDAAPQRVGDGPMTDRDHYTANILTLDIEDWCQSSPEALNSARKPHAPAPTVRTVVNTRRLLSILKEHKTRATCFVLGSVAEAYPDLVCEIIDSGHEIASHGYHHFPVHMLKPEEFRADVAWSLECLEKIVGGKIRGYRAPYFSITRNTDWALPILAGMGIEYDASVFPLHRRYYRIRGWDGAQDADRFPATLEFGNRCIVELPPTTVRILGQNLPFAGGAFLGLLPLGLFRRAIRSANRRGYPGIFYLHPHDLDVQDLRRPVPNATINMRLSRWRLNAGRSNNEAKLRKLLEEFSFTSIQNWMEGNSNFSLVQQAVSQVR